MTADGPDTATVVEVVRTLDAEHPSVLEVAEALADARELPIATAQAAVYDAIDGGVLEEAGEGVRGLRVAEDPREQPAAADCADETPTPDGSETTTRDGDTGVTREDAVAALRDTLKFYHRKVDEPIDDHAGDGDHPERPDTAREYFTDVRGWGDTTVDELLLGWAPPDHVDELVAHLHRRGHSREAMLATGAIGERDSGSLYTTFSGRYVLPYFDSSGEPAYAIARVTGGEGGGAKGYGGHPADGFPGKYAKLRHTDDRVPFAEPIYGLDTLGGADHVVVAEGIADAITARALGYSVLSPVTRQFKHEHYAPLVDALEAHGVDRVTVVADADARYNADAEVEDAETIAQAVGRALETVGAGLDGALRTAANLRERADAVDVRVTVPPAPGDLENDLDDYVTAWGGDLEALLRSARPARQFDAYDTVVDATPDGEPVRGTAGERPDTFDADEYDPGASSASETTDDIRDVYHALDHLDAHRVADETITREVLADREEKQTIAPSWASAAYDGTAVFVDRDKFVDTGSRGGRGGPAVMAAIDAGLISDTQAPEAVEGETWFKAVDHLRDLGFEIPELAGGADDGDEEYRPDPREVDATVDPRRAWDAAGRVTADDLDEPLPQLEDAPDVVRAVAIAEGLVDAGEPVAADTWREAYATARDEFGAPLPEYYTTADAVAEFDAVLGLLGEVTFFHLDEDAIASTVTAEGDEVDGDAVRALDPAWRESDSGESVLVFDSGTVWDADTERVVDAVRFAALEAGAIDDPTEAVEGEAFTAAYQRLRTEYGAALPRWEPALDGARDVTAQLPPAEELLDARDLDGVDVNDLEAAREEVEGLIRAAASDADTPTVVTALPALGKTTGSIKTARDTALSYLAPRKELQQQAVEKAAEWGVDAELLPVFADERVRDEVLDAAVAHVRGHDKTRLRDREALLAAVSDEDDAGVFVQEDEDDEGDEVDLDRATCPTAEGAHGDAWALAVHVARQAFGLDPSAIHAQARGLFGAPLPCSEDHGEDGGGCEYSAGWEDIRDPADPPDLLVGSYVHAHVDSVKTLITGDGDGGREYATRPVVLDEFPGEAYVREFGAEAHDHATWLARSLRGDVEDRRDMYETEFGDDAWVRAWLDGEIDDEADDERVVRAAEGARQLRRRAEVMDAAAEAADLLATPAAVLDRGHMTEALERLADDADALDREARVDEVDTLRDALRQAGRRADLPEWLIESAHDALDRLAEVPEVGSADAIDELPVGAAFREVVERATEYDTPDTLEAAATALEGGPDGCQRLAAWANDGYAHPDAHHLLEAVVTPTGPDSDDLDGRRIHTDAWAFDPEATDGTVLDVVETHGNATTVLDRNDHGALLQTPPSRTSLGGEEAPLVGLDATGRAELWRVALGEDVETADIHETPAERAAFLEDALDLRVLRASDRPRYYSGDPGTKDTDGDAALLKTIADEYTGVDAPRQRGEDPLPVGRPAAITSKGVRGVLENDSRLDDTVAAWEHFGNLAGANDLGEHRLGAVFGCQHYGDDAVERFAALDGEAVDVSRDGVRGAELSYDSALGDEYLQHMTEDQVMQAILRFARGDSGATVVARTGALREDLPVVGEAQVVGTWSDTATEIARRWRALGERFTVADVADAVDVSNRQVRRVLDELDEAGYVDKIETGDGVANEYDGLEQPAAGEVELPDRDVAVASGSPPGHDPYGDTYTVNVRVRGGETAVPPPREPTPTRARGAPPAPTAEVAVEPPD